MKHDKLCDEYGGDDGWGRKLECLCELIAKARADEREKVRALVESEDFDGYEQGQRDALADFLTSVGEDDPVYLKGQRDEREACAQTVETRRFLDEPSAYWPPLERAAAAIRARGEASDEA